MNSALFQVYATSTIRAVSWLDASDIIPARFRQLQGPPSSRHLDGISKSETPRSQNQKSAESRRIRTLRNLGKSFSGSFSQSHCLSTVL
ncbi:unnamed protein product [Haemonchus placei]|uniref:Uncharacterized protein n=1 Tax=Haemonchus placei TaxID=6290 RepID=A0A3P7X122_HAEPC|nr:unnamed protein product [Haemonchus placei]